LYLVGTAVAGSLQFTDNTTEDSLLLNQQLQFTDEFGNDFGVAGNTPPPLGDHSIKHLGRIYISQGQTLFFSKSLEELVLPNGFIAGKYEEAFPGDNSMDISEGAETVRGLLSDGSTLYIGTERHIRRLFGDGPDNFTKPEIVHNEVGVINQETWQIVFAEGQPVGAIWLTPDKRVIGSDFNTYVDIGNPIQDVLSLINLDLAADIAHAQFVSTDEFDFYILHIPTSTNGNNTLCVYDLRTRRWFTWQLAPGMYTTASMFNITNSGTTQWLFALQPVGENADGSGTPTTAPVIAVFDGSVGTDLGQAIPVTAQTTWMHLSMPIHRKILNTMDHVGDDGNLLTIEGSSTADQFLNPLPVITNQPLSDGALDGKQWLIAGSPTLSRYYRFRFTNPNLTAPFAVFLGSYDLWILPISTI
jgi:hypothetical protein